MIKKLCLCGLVLGAMMMASCSEEDSTWNPYTNWQERNATWFEQVTDSARTSIAEAKRLSVLEYGTEDKWEEFTDWRRYKTLLKDPTLDTKDPNDSICVRIIKKGTREGNEAIAPLYNDTVRLNYRGWLMNATYQNEEGGYYDEMAVFDQSYYGAFNEATAAPTTLSVAATVEGFSTALQYMVPGDDWRVYIPQQMAYGSSAQKSIPAYSTLLFRINLSAVYRAGKGVPTWK